MTQHALVLAVLYFMIYSFVGWIAQGFYVGFKKHHFVNTGFMYGPIVPIYGFGALLAIYVIDPFFHNWILVFVMMFLLCSILEYFTSWAMQKLFHRLWWNYANRPFNIHGRVCLLNSTLYGIGGLVITYASQPLVNKLLAHISLRWQTTISIVFAIAFIVDLGFTLYHMAKVDGLIRKIHLAVMQSRLHELNDLQTMLDQIDADRHLKVFENSKLHSDLEASLSKARAHLTSRLSQEKAGTPASSKA